MKVVCNIAGCFNST